MKTSTFLWIVGFAGLIVSIFNIGVDKNSPMDAAVNVQALVLFVGAYIMEKLEAIHDKL